MDSKDLMLGRFCWHDLMTKDIEASQDFYEDMFGWALDDEAAPNGYRALRDGDLSFGGFLPWPQEVPVSALWVGYVLVQSCSASTERVTELGGTLIMPPTPIPGVGAFAPAIDPQGADIVLFEPERFDADLIGTGGTGEIVLWNELITPDIEASADFYAALFDWQIDPSLVASQGYVVARRQDVPVCGLFQPAVLPPRAGWVASFGTADIEKHGHRAAELGGKVVHAIQDVPNIGRTSWFQDSVGAIFGLMQPADGWFETL
jgi:uncharacterized protein